MLPLKNIRIVLINTSHPGNIGAAARAMKTMGLSQLVLVEPKDFPHEKAYFRSAGAMDVVDGARVCSSLDEAISDCQLVIGTSARTRSIPWPMMNPRQCAEIVIQEPEVNQVAILFGREDRGLTNEELQRCNSHLHIPGNPEYSVLNIAAAVQVVCYELRMASLSDQLDPPEWDWGVEWDAEKASSEEMRQFFVHMEETLIQLEVINPESPRQLMKRMRRLYQRSRPDQFEVGIMRGVFTAIQKVLAKNTSSS